MLARTETATPESRLRGRPDADNRVPNTRWASSAFTLRRGAFFFEVDFFSLPSPLDFSNLNPLPTSSHCKGGVYAPSVVRGCQGFKKTDNKETTTNIFQPSTQNDPTPTTTIKNNKCTTNTATKKQPTTAVKNSFGGFAFKKRKTQNFNNSMNNKDEL